MSGLPESKRPTIREHRWKNGRGEEQVEYRVEYSRWGTWDEYDTPEEAAQRVTQLQARIEAAMLKVKPGQQVEVMRNQGVRDGVVLAVIEDEALIEYDMPGGFNLLNLVPVIELEGEVYRTVTYKALSIKWLRAVVDQGEGWMAVQMNGYPRRPLPQPGEYLAQRLAAAKAKRESVGRVEEV